MTKPNDVPAPIRGRKRIKGGVVCGKCGHERFKFMKVCPRCEDQVYRDLDTSTNDMKFAAYLMWLRHILTINVMAVRA